MPFTGEGEEKLILVNPFPTSKQFIGILWLVKRFGNSLSYIQQLGRAFWTLLSCVIPWWPRTWNNTLKNYGTHLLRNSKRWQVFVLSIRTTTVQHQMVHLRTSMLCIVHCLLHARHGRYACSSTVSYIFLSFTRAMVGLTVMDCQLDTRSIFVVMCHWKD